MSERERLLRQMILDAGFRSISELTEAVRSSDPRLSGVANSTVSRCLFAPHRKLRDVTLMQAIASACTVTLEELEFILEKPTEEGPTATGTEAKGPYPAALSYAMA